MSPTVASRPLQVLLVEDSPADVVLAREALSDAEASSVLHVVSDGEEAMAFLRREGDHSRAPRPDLVLLDLNLPRKDGREVLAEVKADPGLRRIPVVVLSASAAADDVRSSYDHMANAYVRKPVDVECLTRVLRSIDDFWTRIVTLPPLAA
jgi:CheY-like chemotaxis protein